MATGLMFVIAMTFGGAGFGRRFRAYSIVTMAIVLAAACGLPRMPHGYRQTCRRRGWASGSASASLP
jgi:hypothetical protein